MSIYFWIFNLNDVETTTSSTRAKDLYLLLSSNCKTLTPNI